MATAEEFRGWALDMPGVSEAPHFDRTAFRSRRIFATLPADGESANLLLPPEEQALRCEAEPSCFAPVPGGWGARGWTRLDLGTAGSDSARSALRAAFAHGSRPARV